MNMALETMIDVPRIHAYPLGSVEELRSSKTYDFEGSIAREMPSESLGKSYKDIHSQSIVLADQAALWNMYLLSKLGKVELPKDFSEVLDYLFNRSYMFNRSGHGNVTDDACDYDNGKELKKTKPTDRSVRWVKRPDRFEVSKGTWYNWTAVGGEDHFILVPASGYVELTVDGSYNPETGTPFSTVDTRKAAEKSWINRGFSPEFAGLAVSYFSSREEGRGTAAVVRWCHFIIGAEINPNSFSRWMGCFPVSRLSKQIDAKGVGLSARPDSKETYK